MVGTGGARLMVLRSSLMKEAGGRLEERESIYISFLVDRIRNFAMLFPVQSTSEAHAIRNKMARSSSQPTARSLGQMHQHS
jgi:hypothetical protein